VTRSPSIWRHGEPTKPRQRRRGTVDVLPSGSLQVRVFAGLDPVSGQRHDLIEIVPAGPKAAAEAEKVRTRLLQQVDEKRNSRTRATVNQLLDRCPYSRSRPPARQLRVDHPQRG